ncbi:MAG TPA: PQQ-dependent sugar dehydrogenase [Flavobacteriales bacterium]|nr:PQQ-dependent sugar dehydrogenase [Flavobacteriales bacterium]
MRTIYTLLAALAASVLSAQSPLSLTLEQVATGLTRITDIAHADDERLFVTLQAGTIRIIEPDGTVLPTPFLNITSAVNDNGNEQGLLGLAFDPAYAVNGRFYVYYTAGTGNGTSRVSRFTVSSSDPNVADPTSEEILYTYPQPYSNHNGGDLDFGLDGLLYVAFGDGGSGGDPQNNAQDLTDPLGDIIRIDVGGETGWEVPADNPWAGLGNDTLPEIWASGLRNPYRFGFDRLTGDLFIGDVGQNAFEEMDFVAAGDNSGPNFGWRCYEANTVYEASGCAPQSSYVAPITVHQQSQQGWCSIIGGRTYRGTTYPRMEGLHIYTDYCGGQFYTLRQNDQGAWVRAQVLASGQFGFSVIAEDADGELYVGNNSSGILYRIKDACPMPLPEVSAEGSLLTSTPANGYVWYFNGQVIPAAEEQTYEATQSGEYYVVADQGTNCQLQSNSVEVIITGVNGLQTNGVRVYPVPADQQLRFEGLPGDAQVLELRDVTGRVLRSVPVGSITGLVTIPVQDLPTGSYAYLVRTKASGLLRGSVSVAH